MSSDATQIAGPEAVDRGPDTMATTDTHPVLPKSLEDLERE